MKYIEKNWEEYKDRVIPKNATEGQFRQLRLAYFAGSLTLFNLLVTGMSPGTEAEPQDMKMMNDIHKEMEEFIADGIKEFMNRNINDNAN